jgi:hypothetical protein
LGSAGELEYYIALAGDLRFLGDADRKSLAKEISEVKAVVTGLLKSVKASLESEDSRTANRER